MERKVLGKGISALIPEKETQLEKSERIADVAISRISPSKYQPRAMFKKERLDELIASIKEKGVVQPVLIREVEEGNYELIAGERRLRAVKQLGFETIPAIVKKVDSNADLLELSLIENIQREGLNSIEEAHAYQRLVDEFSFNLEGIGKAVGKDKTSVSNTIRLLKLPKKIQDHIISDYISMGHGKALLAIADQKEQIKLCEKVVKKGLSVRETERLVNQKLSGMKKRTVTQDQNLVAIEEELQRTLGTKVRILHAKKRGRIQIEYFSLDEMERILKLLKQCSN
ncbi:MAG: ParB/RepB/Spo0J family partition protein [Candidatus Omnitrophica bacterium]|nr:ParB/RepB/Spo0J family partition protein [Candidatus Omnitrophota bacterium]